MVSALSIIVCMVVTTLATSFAKCEDFEGVQRVLKEQLILSTILLIPTLYLAAELTLPGKLVGLVE